jgi:hypothetical protein
MDENHQDRTKSKLAATEDKSTSPPLSSKDQRDEKEAQEELARLRKRLRENEVSAFKTTHSWIGLKGKTLWDWLDLLAKLAIPIVVLGATLGFGWWQSQLAQQQHASDQQSGARSTKASYTRNVRG